MGYLGTFDMLTVISALEIGLARLDHRFPAGAGVSAVQERIARSN
jgi:aspartate aminotransferase-like enzyme